MKVTEGSHCPDSHHRSTCYTAENSKPCKAPSGLREALSSEICNEMFHWDGRVTSHPWVRGNYTISTGISFSCFKSDLLKCTIPEMEYTPRKGERWEFWSGISWPQPISSYLLVLPPLANQYDRHSKVKLLKWPTSLSSRPRGHALFFTGSIIWPLSLFPPLAWRRL